MSTYTDLLKSVSTKAEVALQEGQRQYGLAERTVLFHVGLYGDEAEGYTDLNLRDWIDDDIERAIAWASPGPREEAELLQAEFDEIRDELYRLKAIADYDGYQKYFAIYESRLNALAIEIPQAKLRLRHIENNRNVVFLSMSRYEKKRRGRKPKIKKTPYFKEFYDLFFEHIQKHGFIRLIEIAEVQHIEKEEDKMPFLLIGKEKYLLIHTVTGAPKSTLKVMLPKGILNITVTDPTIDEAYLSLLFCTRIISLQAERDVESKEIVFWNIEKIVNLVIPTLPFETQKLIGEAYLKAVEQIQKHEKYLSMITQAEALKVEKSEQIALNWLLQQEIFDT